MNCEYFWAEKKLTFWIQYYHTAWEIVLNIICMDITHEKSQFELYQEYII